MGNVTQHLTLNLQHSSIWNSAFVACCLLFISSYGTHGNVNTACVHQQSFPCCTERASAERYECMHKSCTDQTYSECFASKTHGYSHFHRETTNHMMLSVCVFSLQFSLFRSSYGTNCYCFLTLVVVHSPLQLCMEYAQRAHTVISMYTSRTPEWIEWMNDREREQKNQPDLVSAEWTFSVCVCLPLHSTHLRCIRFCVRLLDTEWKQNNLYTHVHHSLCNSKRLFGIQ